MRSLSDMLKSGFSAETIGKPEDITLVTLVPLALQGILSSNLMKSFRPKLTTLAGCSAALAALVFTISLAQPSALAQSPAVARSAATMETRSAFATNIEDQLRKRGIDASVQLDGDGRDTLRIEFSNMTRRDVFHFVNSTMVRDAAPMIGFKSVAFSNGEQQWDYDLARESMVSHPVQF